MLSRSGGQYRVYRPGESLEATVRGRLKQAHHDRVLVGDRVRLRSAVGGGVTIEAVLARTSVLRRRTPGGGRGTRMVAANVDQVVVVGAARDPSWEPGLMDRFVAVAEANHLPVTLVINKCDLHDGARALAAPYEAAHYRAVLTSVPLREGIEELRAHLQGQVSLFAGPTGVGKSSLLNAIQPGLKLRTAAVSARSRAGRHTTVSAEMHPLGDEGFVVDTPGLRDIGLWGLDAQDVAAAFPDITALATGCRFDNCRHLQEPGCAIAHAVEIGRLAETRLSSYRRLLGEALDAARHWK